jgi:hypothetical protein
MPPDDERFERILDELEAINARNKAEMLALLDRFKADMHKMFDELRALDERRIEDLQRRFGLRDIGVRRTLM